MARGCLPAGSAIGSAGIGVGIGCQWGDRWGDEGLLRCAPEDNPWCLHQMVEWPGYEDWLIAPAGGEGGGDEARQGGAGAGAGTGGEQGGRGCGAGGWGDGRKRVHTELHSNGAPVLLTHNHIHPGDGGIHSAVTAVPPNLHTRLYPGAGGSSSGLGKFVEAASLQGDGLADMDVEAFLSFEGEGQRGSEEGDRKVHASDAGQPGGASGGADSPLSSSSSADMATAQQVGRATSTSRSDRHAIGNLGSATFARAMAPGQVSAEQVTTGQVTTGQAAPGRLSLEEKLKQAVMALTKTSTDADALGGDSVNGVSFIGGRVQGLTREEVPRQSRLGSGKELVAAGRGGGMEIRGVQSQGKHVRRYLHPSMAGLLRHQPPQQQQQNILAQGFPIHHVNIIPGVFETPSMPAGTGGGAGAMRSEGGGVMRLPLPSLLVPPRSLCLSMEALGRMGGARCQLSIVEVRTLVLALAEAVAACDEVRGETSGEGDGWHSGCS